MRPNNMQEFHPQSVKSCCCPFLLVDRAIVLSSDLKLNYTNAVGSPSKRVRRSSPDMHRSLFLVLEKKSGTPLVGNRESKQDSRSAAPSKLAINGHVNRDRIDQKRARTRRLCHDNGNDGSKTGKSERASVGVGGASVSSRADGGARVRPDGTGASGGGDGRNRGGGGGPVSAAGGNGDGRHGGAGGAGGPVGPGVVRAGGGAHADGRHGGAGRAGGGGPVGPGDGGAGGNADGRHRDAAGGGRGPVTPDLGGGAGAHRLNGDAAGGGRGGPVTPDLGGAGGSGCVGAVGDGRAARGDGHIVGDGDGPGLGRGSGDEAGDGDGGTHFG